MTKQISIIAQARMSSGRLPGKVMKQVGGRSMLGHQILRLKQAKNIKEIIIATGNGADDDVIEREAAEYGVKSFRGSLNDVLGRFYDAAVFYGATDIMRICCDGPFVDPNIIDEVVKFYREHDYEYISTGNLPLGVRFELFPFAKLEEAYLNGHERYHREHVTPYIIESVTNQFMYLYKNDYSKYRLTLDTAEDFRLTEELYKRLYHGEHDFYTEDIIKVMENEPFLFDINKHVHQRTVKE